MARLYCFGTLVTEEEGTVIRDGISWRVIRKAVIRFK